ncbi:MAG TPA: NRDE family protein, partial [Planctomycetaceae bacterium]|nr:NRDE family protein [Planctomycetaceae bacterium]
MRQFSGFPLMVLANREELYARTSTGPQITPRHEAVPAWIGGIDRLAGGTWLGINEFGLVVGVTNREKKMPPASPPSRGLLCRSLLAQKDSRSAAQSAWRELDTNRYAGCNLLMADRDGGVLVEAGDALRSTELGDGLHLIANGALNDPDDLRIRRVRGEFLRARPSGADEWFQAARSICGMTADGSEPPICLVGRDRGTVSSTVFGLGEPLGISQYWFAPGSPVSTPFENVSPLLVQLFASESVVGNPRAHDPHVDIGPPDDSPARRAIAQHIAGKAAEFHFPEPSTDSPYRILLRGPWE